MTWFPQGGAAAGCPACGGTDVGGTLELFHAGLALIFLGLVGWFFRHGPINGPALIAAPPAVQTRPVAAAVERGGQVYPPAKKSQVYVPARKNQVYVSSKKIKSSKLKRRPKKAKTRSKHVQR